MVYLRSREAYSGSGMLWRALVAVFALAAVYVASCFCPVWYRLPWFRSKMRAVSGEAVLVTGASTGIGKHATLTLAKEGYTVFAGVRKEKDGAALTAAAKAAGVDPARVRPIVVDVVNDTQVGSAAEEVGRFVGPRGLYALFNNAGVGGDPDFSLEKGEGVVSAAVEHMPMSDFRRVMEVNFFGVLRVTKAFLPLLRKAKGARIVINTSIAGLLAAPFMSAYAASKFAAEALGDSLHREVHHQGIHVAMLEPGFVHTPIIAKGSWNKRDTRYDTDLYPDEAKFWDGFWRMSTEGKSPRVTSAAVVHALRAEEPARRYVCGGGSEMASVMKRAPDTFKDWMYSATGPFLGGAPQVSAADMETHFAGMGADQEL